MNEGEMSREALVAEIRRLKTELVHTHRELWRLPDVEARPPTTTQPDRRNTMSDQHQPKAFYWAADSTNCPHGPKTQGDIWSDRHPTSDNGPICLDAPTGDACPACSADDGEMVPWDLCRTREHARPKRGVVPNVDAEHQPVTVWVGTLECLDRGCDEYFTEDGEDLPGVERCSHVREDVACSCQRQDDGEYSSEPCRLAA